MRVSIKKRTLRRGLTMSGMILLSGLLASAQIDHSGLLARSAPPIYELGPGDQLTIQVVDLQEFADRTVRVSPDGTIDLPLIGSMKVDRQSLDQLKAELQHRLAVYIDAPNVTVNLVTNSSNKLSVLGEVNAPGIKELSGPTTLEEAISLAGGTRPDAGSRIVLTRSTRWGDLPLSGAQRDITGQFSTASVSLDDLMASKNPSNNLILRPGDIVSIPRASIVYVLGDVHRAGGFPLSTHPTITLLQALSLAEGIGPNAALGGVLILRPQPGGEGKPKEIAVNVKQILAGKAPDPPLFAEDILFVPTSAAKAGMKRAAEAILQVGAGVAIYR